MLCFWDYWYVGVEGEVSSQLQLDVHRAMNEVS